MLGIKEQRLANDLTIKEISQKTGIPLRTYVRLENPEKEFKDGVDGISYGHLKKLGSFFNCSIDYLVSDRSQSDSNSSKFNSDHRIERARLVRWLSKWAGEINDQVDDGHEPMDIVLDFEDASRWNQETVRLKRYLKDGIPNLQRLCALMSEVPDEIELEQTG